MKLLYLALTIMFCCGVAECQYQIQNSRDPNADTVWYRAIYLQAIDASAPARLTSVQDGSFYIYQANVNGSANGSGVVSFIGMATPIVAFQPSDTSKIYSLQFPSMWSGYSGNVSAYVMPRSGVIQTNAIVAKTASYTATIQDGIILMSANAARDTLTLPNASVFGAVPIQYTIKKTDASANVVVIRTNGVQTIDGVTVDSLSTQYQRMTVVSDGVSAWYKID